MIDPLVKGPGMDSQAKKSGRPGYLPPSPHPGRSGRVNSLDRITGSESEGATASPGSRAEVIIVDSRFERTHCADSRDDRVNDTINTLMALMARIAPSIREHVEEALHPLVSALRRREENEQKHREKLLGLEREKLVLERKKLMFKQRRAARCMGPYSNSPTFSRHEVAVKKNPPRAAPPHQADEYSWLREKNTSIASGETQTSSAKQRRSAALWMAEREASSTTT